jgi:hypothetical protein
MGIDTYITVVFWLGILGLVMRSFWLVGEHPRVLENNTGTDAFGFLVTAFFLAWVSYLKFYA